MPICPRGRKDSNVKPFSSSRWLSEYKCSRTCWLTSRCRQTQISSLPKFGWPTGTSERKYPTPPQCGQFGSPRLVLDVIGVFALDVFVAIFFSVSSILLFGTSFFLPTFQNGFAIPPAAFVVPYSQVDRLRDPFC